MELVRIGDIGTPKNVRNSVKSTLLEGDNIKMKLGIVGLPNVGSQHYLIHLQRQEHLLQTIHLQQSTQMSVSLRYRMKD